MSGGLDPALARVLWSVVLGLGGVALGEQLARRELRTTRELVTAVLGLKALLLAVAVLSWAFTPGVFDATAYDVNAHRGVAAGSLEAMLSTWDGQHYLTLAERGYAAGGTSLAFYPLWPALVGLGAPLVGGHTLVAALLLSHALFALACVLLHRSLLRVGADPGTAATGVLLLAAYPGAIFFGLPYSESLFLCLSVALFSLLRAPGAGPWLAVGCALLLPLTRPVGVLAVAPLLVSAGLAWRESRLTAAALAAVLAPIAGWACYFAWMHAATGSALSGFDVQGQFASQGSVAKLFQPWAFAVEFFDVRSSLSFRNGALDRVCFLVYAALLAPLFRRDPVGFAWALVLGVIPAVTLSLMSFLRYAAVIFPLFALAAAHLSQPAHAGRRTRVLAFSTGLQLIFFFLHVNNYWVG